MNQQELQEMLRSLGRENAGVPAPELEARVLAAFDARNADRPARGWWLPATIGAAAATVVFALILWHRPAPPAQHADAPFIAIPYVAPPAPYERTEVKRMDVPLAALMAAGLNVHATDAGGTVLADVLVGQDGRPLAIRLVKDQS